MKGLFEYLKQKITEVKEQNKQDIQALANVIIENQYSTDKVLTLLQSMKANYMNWNILIANEASTGLYYSQLHNRNICLRKIKGNKQMKKCLDKNKMKLNYIKDTAMQIKQISQLTDQWATTVNTEIQQINESLTILKSVDENKLIESNGIENKQSIGSLQKIDLNSKNSQKSQNQKNKQDSKQILSSQQFLVKQQKIQQIHDDDIQV